MALLWTDGFDHYGGGAAGRVNMLEGAWAEVATTHVPSGTRPRNSLYSLQTTPTSAANTGARRVFPTALTDVGVAGAFWYVQLPTTAQKVAPIALHDTNNTAQVTLVVGTTGVLELQRGAMTGTNLATSSGPVIKASTWHHIEMQWISATGASGVNADGTCIVKVDGVTVISLVGNVDNVNTAVLSCSQVLFAQFGTNQQAMTSYLDDVFAWDNTGANNNTFIGDKDILPYYPDADVSSQWLPSSGSDSYAMVNYASTEPDDDTSYIQAATLNDVVTMGIETIPSTVSGIVAVVQVNSMKKTEAGASAVQPALVGGSGGVDSGTAHVMTESYAYYHDVSELNPDTSTAWTAATLSASSIRLTRTT